MSDGENKRREEQPVVVEEYAHNCQIVREDEGEYERYHYENPMGRVKSFDSLDRARLYADVQTVMGGFRDEKIGERGVPPAVARAREDVLAAYLVSNPTMGIEWVARSFGVDEDVVRNYCQMVQERAEKKRNEDS
ncbi:hypothetical protein NDI54_21050 [Haloarcula sp. S1AR25-5A]|uniref:Uncharacterized protein n=1 Tax=Haloarcula terrestris TaxID=2950533 RepID=A0AAE4JJL2_9EURY|nr:hypothetical protein [Haloarcula terrestris]MDS0223820.1 hypothetical protein [Haloarcula terrestris]